MTPESGKPFTYGGLNWAPDIYPNWWITVVPGYGTVSLKFDTLRTYKRWTFIADCRIGDFETLEDAVQALLRYCNG